MDDLVQFLRARLDDDARVALDASGFTVAEDSGQRAVSPAGDEWEAARTECDEDELLVALRPGLARPPEVMSGLWGAIVSDAPHLSQQPGSASVLPQLLHAARHDPAHVLAEVDAKRRILDEIAPAIDDVQEGLAMEYGQKVRQPVSGDLLRLLALPYADHVDYREEWRP